jgi:hypothetical protein
MTISSIPSSSLLTQYLSANSGNGASSGNSIGDQLLAAVAQEQSTSDATSDPLLQTLVTLGSAGNGTSASSLPLTYNAQGLLDQLQSSTANDPLLQFGATSPEGASGIDSSLIDSLLTADQSTGSASPDATSATTSAGSTDVNANWVPALQKDPTLASALIESEMNQGLLSALP